MTKELFVSQHVQGYYAFFAVDLSDEKDPKPNMFVRLLLKICLKR